MVNAADPAKLQILVPGETAVPGSSTGKSGAPAPVQTAGVDFQVTVNLVDDLFNRIPTGALPNVRLTSTDPNDAAAPFGAYDPQDNTDMSGGQITPAWKMITASTTGWTITAHDVSNAYGSAVSAPVPVKPAPGSKLITLLPGQSAVPGSLTGVTGVAAAQVAGAAFTITVDAVDNFANRIDDALYGITPLEGNPVVKLTDTDPYNNFSAPDDCTPPQALTNGRQTFSWQMVTVGSKTISAADIDGSGVNYATYDTVLATVTAASADRLLLLLPGQTHVPGSTSGYAGSPALQTAGTAFTATVKGCDAHWNSDVNAQALVRITASDVYFSTPSVFSLVGGTATVSLTLVTAGTHTVTATDTDASPLAAYAVQGTTVVPNAAVQLLALVPGETAAPGKYAAAPFGKTGSAAVQTAGVPFAVTVIGCDAYWNRTSTYVVVSASSADPFDVHPPAGALIQGATTFTFTLVSANDVLNWNTQWTIAAAAAGSMAGYTTSGISVIPNAPLQPQLLVPGETAASGKWNNGVNAAPFGKTAGSAPTVRTAGVPFIVTINACDAYWNRIAGETPAVDVGASDPNAGASTPHLLANGTTSYAQTFVTRSDTGWTLTGAAGGAYTGSDFTTPLIPVNPNTAAKLLVLLPGQTDAGSWGTATGRAGTPDDWIAGRPYQITVKSCDNYFNFQPADISSVSVATNSAYDLCQAQHLLAAGATTFTVTAMTAGAGHFITAEDKTAPLMAPNVSDLFTVVPDGAVKLQILLPGQTAVPGSVSGKTAGVPTPQTAGAPFEVTVNATDGSWNIASDNSMVRVDSSDPWDIHPATAPLTGGTTTFRMVLVTAAANHTLTATDTEGPGVLVSTTSGPHLTVAPAAAECLQVLVPGETAAAGKWDNGVIAAPFGKNGSPTPRTAGVPFLVTVNLADHYWNTVPSAVPLVALQTNDPYCAVPSAQPLSAGSTVFALTLVTAGSNALVPATWTITAVDVDGNNPLYTAGMTPEITVAPNTAVKLQLILPGETAAPGKAGGSKPGKLESSSVSPQTAGVSFPVDVRACDDWWNVCNDLTTRVTLTTADPNDTELPASQLLTNGRLLLQPTLLTATTTGWTLAVTGTALVPFTSPAVTVSPAGASRLLVLAPNETHAPGSTATGGKNGAITAQTAGVPFAVTVLITDDRWNVVTSSTADIAITTQDPYAVNPPNMATTNGAVVFPAIEFHRGVGEQYAITASTGAGEGLASYTTPPITSNYGAPVKLQILLPGTTAVPGSAAGMTGTPDDWIVNGSSNTVRVRVTDKYWNKVPTSNTTVRLTADDPFYQPPAQAGTSSGETALLTMLNTATTIGWTITASTATGDPYLKAVAPPVKVLPGAAARLLVLLPGETRLPGSATGKTGSASPQTAGVACAVSVYATDGKWNQSPSTQTVRLATTDPWDTEPADQAMVDGYAVFVTTLVTANAGPLNTANRSITITADDVTAGHQYLLAGTGVVTVQPDTANATYLQVLLPGETHSPGQPPFAATGTGGRTGVPAVLTAGVAQAVTVNACDQYWNISPAKTPVVRVATSDPYDVEPATAALISGSRAYSITLRRATLFQGGAASSTTIFVSHDDAAPQYAQIESTCAVSAETAGKSLLVLVPGYTHLPGSAAGKTGAALAQVAGAAFRTTVHCVDTFNNIVYTAAPAVRLTSDDPNDGVGAETGIGWDALTQPLINGSTTFFVPLVTANRTTVLTAADVDGAPPYYGQYAGDAIPVVPANAVKLQIILPGQSSAPNTILGRTGTAAAQTAGAPFAATVNCTDMFWNVCAGSNPSVSVRTDDEYDIEPATAPLVNGTGAFTMTYLTAGAAHTAQARDADSVFPQGDSSAFTVLAAAPARVHVILPNQSFVPGMPPYDGTGGKTGTPAAQTAGTNFSVTVRGTDEFYNLRTDMTGLVTIVTSDPYRAQGTGTGQSLAGGETVFTGANGVMMVTSDTQTITAVYGGMASSTSTPVYVQPNSPTRLLALLPGETAVNGKNSAPFGRAGAPDVQTAGINFPVSVIAVDAYYNRVATVGQNPVRAVSADPNFPNQTDVAMVAGSATVTCQVRTAQPTTFTFIDADASAPALSAGVSSVVSVRAGEAKKLLLLTPGEAWTPGTLSGRSGTPLDQIAGGAFAVTIRTVDDYCNLSATSPIVTVYTADPNDIEPPSLQIFSSGTVMVTMVSASTGTSTFPVSVQDTDGVLPDLLSHTSQGVKVTAGAAKKLLIALPGEQFAGGTVTGKSGTPSPRTAGVSFSVTGAMVDAYWNRVVPDAVVSPAPLVALTAPADPFAAAPAPDTLGVDGTKEFTFASGLRLACTWQYMHGEDITGGANYYSPYNTAQFTCEPAAAVKLQVLLPGTTAVPGSLTGMAGSPAAQTAGTPFLVTVHLVDPYFNITPAAPQPEVAVHTNDPYAVAPASAPLAAGKNTFALVLRTAATSHMLTAVDHAAFYAADQSPQFTLNPAAASQLHVIVPGETHVPGSPTGRTGTPAAWTAGQSFSATIYLTDQYFNRVRTGAAMPTVDVATWDPADQEPLVAKVMEEGLVTHVAAPVTAASTWTVTAYDTGVAYASGTSSFVRVWPGAVHYFTLTDYPAQAMAGSSFDIRLNVFDQYRNLVSSGPQWLSYTSLNRPVRFVADAYPAPQTPTVPLDYDFVFTDYGTRLFSGGVILRRAGAQGIMAYDSWDSNLPPLISSERPGFSTRPSITVNAGAFVKVIVSTDAANTCEAVGETIVPAGTHDNYGHIQVIGQMVDTFNNAISSAGVTVSLDVRDVYGSTGTVKDDGGSTRTSAVTDAQGRVGVSPALYYYVSTKAGDYARVWIGTFTAAGDITPYLAESKNISGKLTTTGGAAYRFAFANVPASITAGQISGAIQVYRYDEFDNETRQAQNAVHLVSDSQALNKGFYFPSDNKLSDDTIFIREGESSASFYYYDELSSYPAGKHGRTGQWTLRAQGLLEAVESIVVDPAETVKLSFDNPISTQTAGRLYDNDFGVYRVFEIQMQDMYGNPTSSTTSQFVDLSSQRLASPTNDYAAFSTSSATISGTIQFSTPSARVEISSNSWFVNVYYKDTRASGTYDPAGSGPVIRAKEYPDRGLTAGSQRVCILPDWINKSVFLSSPQALMAGATSQMFVLQTQDNYSNPSPVKSGDPGQGGVRFGLSSTSSGSKQFYTDAYGWEAGIGTAKIALGEHTTGFKMIDTLAGTFTLTADEDAFIPRGWTAAAQQYTVTPDVPSKLVFASPPRRLMAGTTVQYYPDYETGTATDTVLRVQVRDRFDNVAVVSEATNVGLRAVEPMNPPPGCYAAVDLNNPLGSFLPADPTSTPVPFTLTPGQSEATFYIWAKKAGPITLSASSIGLESAVQTSSITPSLCHHFTVEHPFNLATTPLSVKTWGPVTIQARDIFNNRASGDAVNGGYYSGRAVFAVSGGSTTVSVSTGSFVFSKNITAVQPEPGRFINLQIMDTAQETLRVSATDYDRPDIFGYTTDLRDNSSPDIVTVGVVMTPTDVAPELDQDKQALGIQSDLLQGDGLTPSHPAPVAMLRLMLQVQPNDPLLTSAATATWTSISLNMADNGLDSLPYNKLTEVSIYKDVYTGGGDGLFQGDTVLGDRNSALDLFIGSGTFTGQMDTLTIQLQEPQALSRTPQTYFVCVRIALDAPRDTSIGLIVPPNGLALQGNPSTMANLASNNFPAVSYESKIKTEPTPVFLSVQDISAWYDPGTGGGLQRNTVIPQGYPNTGILRVGMWTNEYVAIWDYTNLTRLGTADADDVLSCKIYRDMNDSRIFEPSVDVPAVTPDSVFNGIKATPVFSTPQLIDQTTKYYFITYKTADSAKVGTTAAVSLDPDSFHFSQGVLAGKNAIRYPSQAALFPIASSECAIVATADVMSIVPGTYLSFSGLPVGTVTQGDTNVPLARMALQASARSVIWNNLRLDRRNIQGLNRDADVSNIKVYYDRGTARLTQNITATTTGHIRLTTTSGFGKKGPYGLLFIGNEIMRFDQIVSSTVVNIPATGRTGILNTAASPHDAYLEEVTATGDGLLDPAVDQLVSPANQAHVFVSSTVSIPILGPKGGQEILSTSGDASKVYFIAYDIDYFAALGQTYLGLDLKNRDYFTVVAPKTVKPDDFPLYSQIPMISEYADMVTMVPENTAVGETLKQGATNQAIISFTAETNHSEALFKTVTVARTGTCQDSDVTAVRLWYDGNHNGLLERTTDDYMIGAGFFGNVGTAGEAFISISTNPLTTLAPGTTIYPATWNALTTPAKATKRYFVTYDISDTALPEYTVGARIENAGKFTVSLPNGTTDVNLPFDSVLRTLVPSQRNVTVTAEALNVSYLAAGIASTDGVIPLQSVAAFPDQGACVIDSEIIQYAARDTVNNLLTGVTRGILNTLPVAHAAGAMVSPSVLQGTLDAPFLKMTLSCDGFQVRWYQLKLDRAVPIGLNGYDADIKQIRIYRDNGSGVLTRDPATGRVVGLPLVSSGTAVFGDISAGIAYVRLGGAGTDKYGDTFSLITATPTIFWVTMDIDQTAAKGSVIGMRCPRPDSLMIGASYVNDNAHRVIDGPVLDYPGDPYPFQSGYLFVQPTLDTLQISNQPYLRSGITQDARDLPMMKLTMKVRDAENTAIWQKVRVDLTGSCRDNDVTLVKVWKDLNGNGELDSVETSPVLGEYPALLSFGTENFAGKTCDITLEDPQVIGSTAPAVYFISYDINSLATVGNTVGLSIASSSYFTLDWPDAVDMIQVTPYTTDPAAIQPYANTVTFQPWPWFNPEVERDVLSGAAISQGDTNVPVLKFRLMTDVSEAYWTKLRVERIGTGAPGQPADGSNADIAAVKVFADANNNGSLDAGDTLISSGLDRFPADTVGPTVDVKVSTQTLRPSAQIFFVVYDIALTAHAGNAVGIRIKDRSWVTVSNPNRVEVFPTTPPFNTLGYFDSSVAQIQPLNVTIKGESIAPMVKLPGDTDVPILKLTFTPNAHQMTVSSITIQQTGSIETIPGTNGYYFGIGDGTFSRLRLWKDDGDGLFDAAKDTILYSVPHRTWVTANGLDPNVVNNFSGGLAILQAGVLATTAGQALFVTADIGAIDLGGRATFGLSTGLQLVGFGSLQMIPDTLVSNGANAFPYKSLNLTIADVSITRVNVRPDMPGVHEEGWYNSNTTMAASWDIVKVPQANVRTFKAAVGSRPDLVDMTAGIAGDGWTSVAQSSTEVKGLALSEPLTVFLDEDLLETKLSGSISVAYPEGHPKYGSNPTDNFDGAGHVTIGREVIAYTGKTGNTFTGITRGALNTEIENHYKSEQLTNRAYFFKVKALTDLAGETPVKWGVVRIDLSAPSAPNNVLSGPAKTRLPAPEGKYEVTWDHARDYESGVLRYEVQERVDADPVWKTIDVVPGDRFSINVGDGGALDAAGNSIPDTARAPGHFYYYRLRAQNNAGSWGEWSPVSAAAPTGLPSEVISSVSNYPNPVDTRRGGEDAKTNIVYVLNQDAEVTITLYDLLGYQVYAWTFKPGENGGRMGANRVAWDGSNEAGFKVAKGGYIAQIKVKSDKGIVTSLRKIGVIH